MIQVAWPWLPFPGADFGFRADGLALVFALLVVVIGALVILYARYYLDAADPMARFYAFFMLFMGAMLGLVLAGNLLLLAVFWELTSLASFLLIGYWQHRADARQGARMALVVTGAGGLACWAACCCSARSPAASTSTSCWPRARRSARIPRTCRCSRWCCSAPSPSRRSSRSTSGCRRRWPRRRRCRPTCTRPRW